MTPRRTLGMLAVTAVVVASVVAVWAQAVGSAEGAAEETNGTLRVLQGPPYVGGSTITVGNTADEASRCEDGEVQVQLTGPGAVYEDKAVQPAPDGNWATDLRLPTTPFEIALTISAWCYETEGEEATGESTEVAADPVLRIEYVPLHIVVQPAPGAGDPSPAPTSHEAATASAAAGLVARFTG